MNSKKELSEQLRKFCVAYVENGNSAHKAALIAGYSEDYAKTNSFKLLRKPNVKAYINKLLEKIDKKIGVSFDYKIQKLKLAVDRALPDDEKSEATINPQIGITAIAELNKMQGHYSAEKHINANLNTDTEISDIKELMDGLIAKHDKEF